MDVEREIANEGGRAEPFTEDEADLVRGAMSLSTTKVRDVMVPRDRVFALDANAALDAATCRRVDDEGFSRVPILDGDRMATYLLVKELLPKALAASAAAPPRVADLPKHHPVWAPPRVGTSRRRRGDDAGGSRAARLAITCPADDLRLGDATEPSAIAAPRAIRVAAAASRPLLQASPRTWFPRRCRPTTRSSTF